MNSTFDTTMGLILVMSAVTMGSRLIGFFAIREARGAVGGALHYLPYGLFAAVVVSGISSDGGVSWLPRLAAVLITAWTAWRGTSIVLSLLLGFGAAWLLEFVL